MPWPFSTAAAMTAWTTMAASSLVVTPVRPTPEPVLPTLWSSMRSMGG